MWRPARKAATSGAQTSMQTCIRHRFSRSSKKTSERWSWLWAAFMRIDLEACPLTLVDLRISEAFARAWAPSSARVIEFWIRVRFSCFRPKKKPRSMQAKVSTTTIMRHHHLTNLSATPNHWTQRVQATR